MLDAEHVLGPDETAQFDPTTPYWYGAADDNPVEILHLFGRTATGRGRALSMEVELTARCRPFGRAVCTARHSV